MFPQLVKIVTCGDRKQVLRMFDGAGKGGLTDGSWATATMTERLNGR